MNLLKMIFGEQKPMSEIEFLPDGTVNPFWTEKINYQRTWVEIKKHKGELWKDRIGNVNCKHEYWEHDEWYRMTDIKKNKVMGLFYCKSCSRSKHKEVDKMKLLEKEL